MRKILFVLFVLLLASPSAIAKEKKSKKSKKAPKNKNKIEKIEKNNKLDEADDYLNVDGVEFDETEIITREQIDTMFSLAGQLNADLYAAINEEDEDAARELDQVIADEKKQLDKMLPALKRSSEWTESDGERLKVIGDEYKQLLKQYKRK